jgi:NAD(P)-dependent dehydrogenase (short-subunit alcohol dehydrogenase family)
MTEKVLPKIIDSFATRNALGRPGAPGELGGCALFLASPASDYVNGDVMVVNGGPV